MSDNRLNDKQPIELMRERGSVYLESASNDELLFALEAAKLGTDAASARALMQEMLNRIRSGDGAITPFVLHWAGHAFGKILEDGYTADQAFGLKLKKGMYERQDHFLRDIQAVATVVFIMRTQQKTRTFAIGETANLIFPDGTGDKAIEEACAKYFAAINIMSTEVLESIAILEARS